MPGAAPAQVRRGVPFGLLCSDTRRASWGRTGLWSEEALAAEVKRGPHARQ